MSEYGWVTKLGWFLSGNSEVIRDIALTLAAIIGFPLVFWRTLATHRQSKAALQQADTASERHRQQTDADRQQRITETFARAIDQLGSEKVEVRVGGIHALARIARESPRDHWPIIETLTAFVREKVSLPYPDSEAVEKLKRDEQATPRRLRSDVQAALTAIGHRCRDHDPDGARLDLAGTDLSRAFLEGAHLEKANLSGTLLIGALLAGAHLDDAYLSGAHLEGAILQFAKLARVSLEGAHLDGANLRGAVLDVVDLRGATLANTCLVDADLRYGMVGLTQEQLDEAFGDPVTTKLPEGMTIPRYRVGRHDPQTAPSAGRPAPAN